MIVVHDLPLWTLTSGMHVAMAHLVSEIQSDPSVVLRSAQAVLSEKHGIPHATFQVENGSARECDDPEW